MDMEISKLISLEIRRTELMARDISPAVGYEYLLAVDYFYL